MEPEWVDWMTLTPTKRWEASRQLFQHYVRMGGTLDPDPDPQSPFWSRDDCRRFARAAIVSFIPRQRIELDT